MVTVEQVRELVKNKLNDPEADVNGIEGRGGRVFGFIVSKEFTGLNVDQRTAWVNKNIRRVLGTRAENLGVIVPIGPEQN